MNASLFMRTLAGIDKDRGKKQRSICHHFFEIKELSHYLIITNVPFRTSCF